MRKQLIYIIVLISILIMNMSIPQTQAVTMHAYQDVTAYVGGTYGHGRTQYPNEAHLTVAVHQKSYTDSSPMYPFGTDILTTTPLYLPGYGEKSTFTITDTGDLFRYRSTYWIDIYF